MINKYYLEIQATNCWTLYCLSVIVILRLRYMYCRFFASVFTVFVLHCCIFVFYYIAAVLHFCLHASIQPHLGYKYVKQKMADYSVLYFITI